MKKLILLTTFSLILAGCSSAPSVKEPTGNWEKINLEKYYINYPVTKEGKK